MTAIDNVEQYEAWNGESGRRWVADADRRDQVLTPVGDTLLNRADIGLTERVLDIGCGCGATTLAAAIAAGPDGSVSGLDLSAPMLAVARERADAAGLTNIGLVQADAQGHPLPDGHFDVAISRFGTMFFADPTAAFTNIARGLRDGGRLVIATWQPLAANEWLAVPGAALLRFGSLPDAGAGPGMFAQSDPALVSTILDAAGFHRVEIEAADVVLTLGADPDEATDYLASSGIGRAALDTVPDEQRPAALAAVRDTLADRRSGAGVQLGAAILVTRAVR
jgi:SAM-dependent methyltransferase